MDLTNLNDILDKAGFDANISDGVVTGRKDQGENVIEVTVDESGGCLVKKSTNSQEKTKLVNLLGRNINVVFVNSKTAQLRVKLQNSSELLDLLKGVEKL